MEKLVLTRKELYDIVWDRPIKHIASELDISAGSISEACKILISLNLNRDTGARQNQNPALLNLLFHLDHQQVL